MFQSKISSKRYELGENEVVRRVRTVGSYLLPNMAFWNNAHTLKVEILRPHICNRYHRLYPWRKICHGEKFFISVKNLNNLWSFIEIYPVFVLNLCGEKSVRRKSLWRKNDKYEVCSELIWILAKPLANIQTDKILQS